MEKDLHQPESLATVTIKPDYAPSESFSSSEPPPAYHKPHSSAVQVAKIISFTVIAVTVILGCFMLASAYVSATASCRELEQEMELLAAASERFQPLQPEALVQDESQALAAKQQEETKEEKPKKPLEDMIDNKIEDNEKSDEDSDEEEKTIHIKMPLELDFDDLANSVMQKNQKSKLNCIVERKRAEQVVDHQPKTIQLPFGLNLTTDPKFEHISGERMAILCESGHEVSDNEDSKENSENEDSEEETIMIQPIMIPIPHTNFQTHMPMQIQQLPMVNRLPMPVQQQQQPIHPMETMRPPMPNVQGFPVEPPQQTPNFPPAQVLQHIAQQIIAQRLQMEAAAARQQQMDQVSQQQVPPQVQQQIQQQMQQQQIQQQQIQQQQMQQQGPQVQQQMQQQEMRNQIQQQLQQRMQMQMRQQQMQEEESNENTQEDEQQDDGYSPIDYVVPRRMSIPEQILTQINRLPNSDVIVAVSQPEEEESQGQSVENQVVQQQRMSASEMNGRQSYARHIPMNIPMRVVPVEQPQQDNQAAAPEDMRPHFVHPRSVRSVDNVLKPAKRVKRCSCDCAC